MKSALRDRPKRIRLAVGPRLLALLLLGALAAVSVAAGAQETRPPLEEREEPTAPVVIDGITLFRVRGVSAYPPAERAAAIADRIRGIARDPAIPSTAVQLKPAQNLTAIVAGDRPIMSVLDADATIERIGRDVIAGVYAERIRSAIEAYRVDRAPDRLLRGAISALVATVVFGVVLAALVWLIHRLRAVLQRRYGRHVASLEAQAFRLIAADQIWRALRLVLRAVLLGVVLLLGYLYLSFVLSRFPWTRGASERLLDVLLAPLTTMGEGILANIPGLLFLIVLVLVVRALLGLLYQLFESIDAGRITIGRFDREWAWPAYRIARIVVIAFAAIVAYPYIPGSNSDAFKGVTIFFGVMFSLGASSVISNILAGYSLIFRRIFKVGDRVRINDMVGDVEEIRLQVTHLRSIKNEELIIPNSVILGSQVTNYSSYGRQQGLILHTTVGIGYETPWRQVEAMLLEAAARTPGLRTDPPPFVFQTALGDFAVTYEINAFCDDAHLMGRLYTALHQSILDVFNEHGVQIMTPAYEGDPAEPKIVPKDQWHLPPSPPPTPTKGRP
jgi:small-conductance mechanosensitive channel